MTDKTSGASVPAPPADPSWDWRNSVCPYCENEPQARLTCPQCCGGGRLPNHRARPRREARWPARTAAGNAALLRQLGERYERDVPKTRIGWRGPDEVEDAA